MEYCSRCDRYFSSNHALEQHLESSSRHHACDSCNRDFATEEALTDHWRDSSKHSYCKDCDEHFEDDDELEGHWVESSSHFYCQECNEHFDDNEELEDHLDEAHFYCSTCARVSLTLFSQRTVHQIFHSGILYRQRFTPTQQPETLVLHQLPPGVPVREQLAHSSSFLYPPTSSILIFW